MTYGTRRIWQWLFCLAVLGVTACSPYSFQKEVTDVSTGVDQLSDGFTSGYAAFALDRSADIQIRLAASRSKVSIASSCLVSPGTAPESQAPCALFAFGDTPPALSAIEQKRAATLAALAVLKSYAHGLAAVTNAADRTAFDAAVSQLAGSVGGLANAVDPAAPGVDTVAPAVVNLAGWVFGTALDQDRFDSLKAAVTAVGTPNADKQIPIHVVATTLGDGLLALNLARRAVLVREINFQKAKIGPALSEAAYQQQLTSVNSLVSVLEGLRQADATAAAQALSMAHDALVAAVHDPKRNYPALQSAVDSFTSKAAALRTAMAATPANPTATATNGS